MTPDEIRRLCAMNADLLTIVREAMPVLRRHATEEARANRAPTGLPKRTGARELLAFAERTIAEAGKVSIEDIERVKS